MKIQIWSKALLKSYSNLSRLANNIDGRVFTLAHSMSNARYGNTTEIVADKILKYVDKKVTLCKTKVLIEDILMKLNDKYATVLKMRFVDNKSYEEIANYFGVCVRTIRRYLAEAIKHFSFNLKVKSYTPETLSKMYENEKWMGNLYLSNLKNYLKSKNMQEYEKFMREHFQNGKIIDFQEIYSYELS